jgi:hypothetical protein
MTISDQSRHRLHQRLDDVLGADEAATLMEHLPPVGWADVATKRDLDHLATLTKANVDRLGTELRSEMQTGFAELRSEMQTGFSDVRTEMRVGFADLRTELHKETGAARRQLPTMFLGLVGLQMSAAGLAVTLSHVL